MRIRPHLHVAQLELDHLEAADGLTERGALLDIAEALEQAALRQRD